MKNLMFILAMMFLFLGPLNGYASRIGKEYFEIQAITNSRALNKQEKINKLMKYFNNDKTWERAAYALKDIDQQEALRILLQSFDNPRFSRERKLYTGRLLLQLFKYDGFIPSYKEFLVGEIVNNVGDFTKKHNELTISGVGEYAFIAAGFMGYDSIHFEQFKDSRAIPNLIVALGAPDDVYAKDQGDLIRGIPGFSTGRNLARQNIPVALAKLNAKDAVPALLKIFKNHHDYYLKNSSAYALGYLLERKEKEDFYRLINSPLNHKYRFAFGRGLIEQRDMNGLAYIRLEDCGQSWSSVLYDVEQKLSAVKNIRDTRLRDFYAEVLNCKIFRQLVSDGQSIKKDPTLMGHDTTKNYHSEWVNHNLERVARVYEDVTQGILLNGFTDLAPFIKAMGENSTVPRIQDTTVHFLKGIYKTLPG